MAIFTNNNNKSNGEEHHEHKPEESNKFEVDMNLHHTKSTTQESTENMNNSIPFSIPVGMGDYNRCNGFGDGNGLIYLIFLALMFNNGWGNQGRWGQGFPGMTPAGAEIAGSIGANIDAARAKIAEVAGMVESGKCDLKGIEAALGNLGLKTENTKDLLVNVLGRLSDEVSRGNSALASQICECCCSTKSIIQDSTYKIGDRICGVEKEILRGTADVNQNLAGLGFAVERNAGQIQNAMTQGFSAIGFNQERVGNSITNAVNSGFCQTNSVLSRGFSDLGYLSEKNTNTIVQTVAAENNATRDLIRALHTEDQLAAKQQVIDKLYAKNEELSRRQQSQYIINELRQTSGTTTTTTP